MVNVDTMDENLVGQAVSIVTTLQETIEGRVFAVDGEKKLIVLQCASKTASKKSDVYLIKQDHISKVEIKPAAAAGSIPDGEVFKPTSMLPQIDYAKIKERERVAIQKMEKAMERIGVGVTPEAQRIFDFMAKTMPCRWEGKTIVVLDDVRITEPYKPDNCTGSPGTRDHVLKLLAAYT